MVYGNWWRLAVLISSIAGNPVNLIAMRRIKACAILKISSATTNFSRKNLKPHGSAARLFISCIFSSYIFAVFSDADEALPGR